MQSLLAYKHRFISHIYVNKQLLISSLKVSEALISNLKILQISIIRGFLLNDFQTVTIDNDKTPTCYKISYILTAKDTLLRDF